METPKEYYYTYYSYEEWGRGYIGSRGCECLPEKDIKYFGSFKDKSFRPTQKIILEIYETREEAIEAEIILHDFYDVANNPHFANKAKQTSTKFYISKEMAIEQGKKTKELGIGIFGLSSEQITERNRKISQKNIGKSLSAETRKKQSKAKKGKYLGENASFYGRHHTEKTRKRLSEINKGKNHPQYGKRGKDSPKYGKSPSIETRKKQSESLKGRYVGENSPNYGKKWWTDGCENNKMSLECPGEGWVLGRGKRWEDGCGNIKFCAECPGEGWVTGNKKSNNILI